MTKKNPFSFKPQSW